MSDALPLSPLLGGVLDLLAERVAERVLDKIGTTSAPPIYTTGKMGPHVPGKSRRWMLEHLKTMPGAIRVGRDWQIGAADYEAWAQAEDARRCSAARPPLARAGTLSSSQGKAVAEPEDPLASRAARSLDAQGYRRTR